MYCKICGASLAPGDVVCKNCGASNLNNSVEPVVPSVEPSSVNPSVEPVAPTVEPIAPSVEPSLVAQNEVFDPNLGNANSIENVPIVEEKKQEEITETKEEKANEKFLVVIGVIVGILAALVIGYLIYGSLKNKNEGGNPGVTVVTQNSYNVIYGDYKFNLTSDISSSVGEHLKISKANWEAKIHFVKEPEFSQIKNENLKKAFEDIEDYKVGEFTLKEYNSLSCLEANVDYTGETKTTLIICDRKSEGYWYAEIGTNPYNAYPNNSVVNEIAGIISDARKMEASEEKLKIDKIEIPVDEEEDIESEANN